MEFLTSLSKSSCWYGSDLSTIKTFLPCRDSLVLNSRKNIDLPLPKSAVIATFLLFSKKLHTRFIFSLGISKGAPEIPWIAESIKLSCTLQT